MVASDQPLWLVVMSATGLSDGPLSSGVFEGLFSGVFVAPRSAYDSVGEVAFVGSTVLEHLFDLANQGVVNLQRLHRPERRFRQQRPRRGDGVDRVGLVQAPRAALGGGPRRRDFAGVEPGRRQSDRDMGPPLGRSLHADLFDTVTGEQIDRPAITGPGVREGLAAGLNPAAVDDADGEGVLVGDLPKTPTDPGR